MKKKITLIVALLICLVVCAGGIFASRYQRTSDKRLPDRYGTEIVRLQSSEDKDGDGIDDQTDILQGALMYVGTHPKYKSRYYQTGYPNDGYGVCTDVVAYALQNAGYDLMELVAQDIQENPDGYDIDQPDKKIDFRRVRNLKVYFADTAIPLTTSLADIEQWQGGDIVIFESHIGIVSDRRNADGVPMSSITTIRSRKAMKRIFLKAGGISSGITGCLNRGRSRCHMKPMQSCSPQRGSLPVE